MAQFDTQHNDAFRALGAKLPGMAWSAFDVNRPDARLGLATRFVTTIWNVHSTKDAKGHRTPTELAIGRDQTDGSLWYRFSKPTVGTPRKAWVAHWNRLELAIEHRLPIIGVLKDVSTSLCSLTNVFDCGTPRRQIDGSAIWLELKPRGEIGTEVRPIDIRQLLAPGPDVLPVAEMAIQFEEEVQKALTVSPEVRRARLAAAPRLPKRVEVTTTAFARNPYVVAEVLSRAAGICEGCIKPAPFLRRSDNTPYLEVHHRVLLADGGEDTVENAIALCPNCHRFSHYG